MDLKRIQGSWCLNAHQVALQNLPQYLDYGRKPKLGHESDFLYPVSGIVLGGSIMLNINPETVCIIVAKVCQFQAKEEVVIPDVPISSSKNWGPADTRGPQR